MLHNFNAGPASLPATVLQQAAQAILNYNNSGLSILEIPHRNKIFTDIIHEANALVNELAQLDNEFEILWLQGGGRMAFAMIPMNFLQKDSIAAYVDSGHWSAVALEHAAYYGKAENIATSKEAGYKHLPSIPFDTKGKVYVHFTTNNTIEGTQWHTLPSIDAPVIADMSSDIFGVARNYKDFDLFYAVAQKNLGPSGVTMLAIKKSFLAKAKTDLPGILSYIEEAKQNSLLNTPPVFAIYTSLLNLRWIKEQGLQNIIDANEQKAQILYDEIERNTLFQNNINPADRSFMNVVFTGKDKDTEAAFLDYAASRNIVNIAGHRSVGAFRASLYNAITIEQVQHLVQCMQAFEKNVKNK